jgi:putative transposase
LILDVDEARDWPWPSPRFRQLAESTPVETPNERLEGIGQPLCDHELTTLRTCVNRQQPFGADDWQAIIAKSLGLESTLRRRGRPSKRSEK